MSRITGTCCSETKKRKALTGMPRGSSEWVFTKIHGFPGFGLISRFGSKDLSIPKMIRPKMMPWSASIHRNAPNLLFYKKHVANQENLSETPNPKMCENPKNLFPRKVENKFQPIRQIEPMVQWIRPET